MSDATTTPEAHIRATDGVATLINVFTVEPAKQQQLVDAWQKATDDVMRHLPGFISASIHRSDDGTKVINYAQWESRDAFAAMFGDPQAQAHLAQLSEIGTPDPAICDVVSVHRP